MFDKNNELNTSQSTLSKLESVISNVTNILFWFGLFIVVTCNTMYVFQFINVVTCNMSFMIGAVCLFTKIIADFRFVKKIDLDLVFRIIAIISAYLTYKNTFSHNLLFTVFIVIASKNIEYKKIAKMYLVINASIFVCNLIAMISGLKINRAFETKDISHFRAARYCFGCPHPNGFMGMLIVTICCIIIVYKDKLNNVAITVISVISAGFFIFTESRSGLLVILAIIILLYVRNTKIPGIVTKYRIAEKIWGFSIIFMIVSGFILNGKRPFVLKLINTFTTRIVAFGKAYKKIGISLFGKINTMKYPLDSGFYIAFFTFGIVGFIVLCVLISKALNKTKDDYYLGVTFIAICIETLFESGVVGLIFTLPLIAAYANLANECDNHGEKDVNLDRNTCKENNKNEFIICSTGIMKTINFALSLAIPVLLLGQSIIWKISGSSNELNEYLVGPNPVIYDVILIGAGLFIGVIISVVISKRNKNQSLS